MADTSSITRDDALGRLALARRLITREQLRQARKTARAAEASGERPPPLIQLLVRDGISASALASLLRELSTQGDGRRSAVRVVRVPAEVAGYSIVRELGRGGMGVVYEAVDPQLGRRVALKLMTGDPLEGPARARFQREAQLAARLSHPGIVGVHGAGLVEPPGGGPSVPYIAMTHAEGTCLADRFPELSREARLQLFEQLTDALAYAHGEGVVHRDVKPANILLTADGRPLLADFGLARGDGDLTLTATGTVIGSVHYMSPEQVRGERVGPPADVWALGVILYELLTDERPFDGQRAVEVYERISAGPPEPPRSLDPEIPAALEAICLAALQSDPAQRYASASELADDLRRWRSGEAVNARGPTRLEAWRTLVTERPRLAAVALAAVTVTTAVAVVLGGLWWRARAHAGRVVAARSAADDGDWAAALDAIAGAEAIRPSEALTRLRADVERRRADAAREASAQAARAAARARLDVRLAREGREIEEVRQLCYRSDAPVAPRLRALEARLVSLAELARRPEHADAAALHALLGRGWLLTGDTRRAETALRRAVALAPADGRSRAALGRLASRRSIAALILGRSGIAPGLNQQRAKAEAEAAVRWMAPVDATAWAGARPIERHVVGTLLALARGQIERVRQRCAAGLEQFGEHPGSEDYWQLLACVRSGPAVTQALDRALARKPHDAWLLTLRGAGHRQLGDAAAAERDLRGALELHPQLAEAHCALGVLLAGRGDTEGALACYDRAVALGDPIARINRGGLRRLRGDHAGALADLDAVIAAGSTLAGPFLQRALVRSDDNRDLKGALADAEAALAREPRSAEAYAVRGWIRYRTGWRWFREALADLSRSLELDPAPVSSWYKRGIVRHELRDFHGAIEDFGHAIRRKADHAGAHLQRGRAWQMLGKGDEALADFNRSITLEPGTAGYLNRGNLLLAARRYAEARADFDRALALDKTYFPARMNRAAALTEMGQLPAALADYQAVIAQKPDYALAHAHAGQVRFLQGDADGALKGYQAAIRLDPKCYEGWYYMGLMHMQRGHMGDAQQALLTALQVAPQERRGLVQKMLTKTGYRFFWRPRD